MNRQSILTGDDKPAHSIHPAGIAPSLRATARWINWDWVRTDDRWNKAPKQSRDPSRNASSTDPSTWTDFDTACSSATLHGLGLGFVLADDGITGVDLDDCRDPASGDISGWAQDILEHVRSYAEVSPSLTGIKIFVRGTLPDGCRKKHPRPEGGEVEIYSNGRFFTVTGQRVYGSPDDVRECQTGINSLLAMVKLWRPDQPVVTTAAAPVSHDREIQLKRARAYLDAVPGAVSGSGGSDHTFIQAKKLAGFMLSRDEAFELLSEWNVKCEPPWSEKELNHKIDDAFKVPAYPMEDRQQDSGPAVDISKIVNSPVSAAQSAAAVEVKSEEWPEPIPFGNGSVAAFPVDALPKAVRPFILDLAEFTQTPVDLAGGMWLAGAAGTVQKKYVVDCGWKEQLSLFVLSVMEPANRKSAVVAAISEPIRRFEYQLRDAASPDIRAKRLARDVLVKQRADLMDKAAKLTGADKELAVHELEKVDEQLSKMRVPALPTLLVDDCTPERMVSIMSKNGGRLAVLTAEGDLFDILGGRYSGSPNTGIVLRGHCGDEYRVDRKDETCIQIDSPALSMGFCVQPDVLNGMMQKKQFRGRGLLGRILFQMPASLLGTRKLDVQPIDPFQSLGYYNLMHAMLSLPLVEDSKPIALRLSKAAANLFREFRDHTEKGFLQFGSLSHVKDWGGKLDGAVARIAGIFHITEHVFSGSIPIDIAPETVSNAIKMGEYFTSHALAAFQVMADDECCHLAEVVVDAIKRQSVKSPFNRRDVYQCVRRQLQNGIGQFDKPLELMVEFGYLREHKHAKRSHNALPKYDVNPRVILT